MFQTEKNKTQKEKKSQKEVFEMIDGWGEDLEVRLVDDEWEDVKKEIWLAVKNERLAFNSTSQTFTYVLLKPITSRDNGEPLISILEIQETQMCNKRDIMKSKEDVDTTASMFKAYCTKPGGEQIEHGFLTRLYDRDVSIISAVILGFFVQAVPSRKRG